MKKVCIIGTGYVGLVTGTCLADLGHRVICVDRDKTKIDILNGGSVPIYEPGLEELVRKNRRNKRLIFTTSIEDGVREAEIIVIAVNTPPQKDGGADLSFVETCTREVARYSRGYKLLLEKSTVPVQTGDRIIKTLSLLGNSHATLEVASNPEFLKEGTAIEDFMKPDRLVFGVQSKKAERILRELYAKIKAPVVVTDIRSAELIKHASNSFLALKISYINSIANICRKVGADVELVAKGMGFDPRIGRAFLNAGIGYGGSCFPKDVSAFIKIAEKIGYDFQILKATEQVNREQKNLVLHMLEEVLWTVKDKVIAVWGLAFKPNTDDLRNAPSIDIIGQLINYGAKVKAYDPVAANHMKTIFPDAYYGGNAYDVAKGADAVILVTEWAEFKNINLARLKKIMNTPIFIDGRNLYDVDKMARAGFRYYSIGRPTRQ